MTTTTLSRRLTYHLQKGSIKKLYQQAHQKTISRKEIAQNTKIIENSNNRKHIRIKESLLILQKSPSINKPQEGFESVLLLRPHIQGRESLQCNPIAPYTQAGLPTSYRDDPDNTTSMNIHLQSNNNTHSAQCQ